MIDQFFKQTNKTIWNFLREIGNDKQVFSSFFDHAVSAYCRAYIYAAPNEIVLMYMDIRDEQTPMCAVKGKGDKWYDLRKVLPDGTVSKDADDWEPCPLYYLYDDALRMRKFLVLSKQFSIVPAIHLMLLTNYRIINYQKFVRSCQQNLFGISVLHNLQVTNDVIRENRYNGQIPVNGDFKLECSAYYSKYMTYLENRGYFDGDNPLWDDWPRSRDKRYKWKGEKGHLISDEFEDK